MRSKTTCSTTISASGTTLSPQTSNATCIKRRRRSRGPAAPWCWTGAFGRAEREAASAHYRDAGIPFEWHYVEISDSDWRRNIASRNAAVAAGETTDYAVDSGLLEKLESLFEPPKPEEACVLHRNTR